MKCALCHERKGKRGCKLTSAQLICPSCCASTRRAECDGCGYYEASLAYQLEKQVRKKPFITEIIPDVDDQCDEALALVEKGDIAQGLAVLEDLRRQHPNYHTVLYGIGVCHGMKGQMDEAISCLERAVEIFPAFAHAHYNLGSSYRQKLDLENAVKAYEAAIAADGSGGDVGRLARERLDELEAIAKETGISLSTHIRNRRIFDRGFLALQEVRDSRPPSICSPRFWRHRRIMCSLTATWVSPTPASGTGSRRSSAWTRRSNSIPGMSRRWSIDSLSRA